MQDRRAQRALDFQPVVGVRSVVADLARESLERASVGVIGVQGYLLQERQPDLLAEVAKANRPRRRHFRSGIDHPATKVVVSDVRGGETLLDLPYRRDVV